MIIDGLYYTKEHEWLKVDGGSAIMGITDHAQELLGEVTFVELPEVGQTIKQHGQVSAVESSKAASDVYAPAAGTVSAVNNDLEAHPELINDSCYEEGWICKLNLSDPTQVESLLDAKQYREFIKAEES